MKKTDNVEDVRGCKLLKADKFIDDRGNLCFVEGNDGIPFSIQRIFWIYGVPPGKSRGGHSHSTCSEAIFPLKGHFDIRVTDGINEALVHLDSPDKGILIPNDVWCDLHNFSEDCILVVAASQHYNVEGYCHNYNEFMEKHQK